FAVRVCPWSAPDDGASVAFTTVPRWLVFRCAQQVTTARGGPRGARRPYVPPGLTSASGASGGPVGHSLPAPQPGPDDTAESFLVEPGVPALPPRYSNPQIVGQGGLCTIYKAFDTRAGRPVMLKLIPVVEGKDIGVFLDELRAVSQLNHPSIVPL